MYLFVFYTDLRPVKDNFKKVIDYGEDELSDDYEDYEDSGSEYLPYNDDLSFKSSEIDKMDCEFDEPETSNYPPTTSDTHL